MIINRNDYSNIICNNYIPLIVRHVLNSHIDFNYEGILEIEPEGLKKFRVTGGIDDIIQYIKVALDNNCYVVMSANEYYLKGRLMYGKNYFKHDVLLYDYDDGKRSFSSIGYNLDGHYDYLEHSYDEITKAYYSLQNEWEYEVSIFGLFDLNEKNFNIRKVISDLKSYIQTEDISSACINDFIQNGEKGKWYNAGAGDYFGADCYDFLNQTIEAGPTNDDERSILVVTEHSNIMKLALDKLQEKGVCCYNTVLYKSMQNQLKLLKMKHLKYMITFSQSLIKKMTDDIHNIKEMQIEIIGEAMKNL